MKYAVSDFLYIQGVAIPPSNFWQFFTIWITTLAIIQIEGI